jgi:hypothetical protein
VKLLPTGTCFDDALELMAQYAVNRPEVRDRLVLVHGICHFPPEGNVNGECAGEPYAHGWLELDGEVWQCAILPEPLPELGAAAGEKVAFTKPIAEHYERLRITDTTRYTLRQAYEENARTELFGPWVERYQVLCGSVRFRRSA